MYCPSSKVEITARQGFLLRTLLVLATIVPVWHSAGLGFFHGTEGEVMAASPLFDKASVLPYPSAPMEFVATAYCEAGITKSGVPVEFGLVAADPLMLPLGSWIHIEHPYYRGIYQVMDTGRFIKGKRIDIFLPTWREATEFGRQKIQVTVIKYARATWESTQSGRTDSLSVSSNNHRFQTITLNFGSPAPICLKY